MSELGYIIDCSFEMLESTPDLYSSLQFAYYNHNYDVERTFHAYPKLDTLDIMSIVESDILNLQKNKFSFPEVHFSLLSGFFEVNTQIISFIDAVSDKLIDNYLATVGEVPENPFGIFLGNKPEPINIYNTEDMLHPFLIQEVIASNRNLNSWTQKLPLLFSKVSEMSSCALTPTLDYYIDFQNKLNEKLDVSSQVIKAQHQASVLKSNKNPKSHKKTVRNSIKRAINLFSSFFGEEKIKAFLRGDSFIVEGKHFHYLFKRSQTSIITNTSSPSLSHIPYSLEIMDNNVVLANICVVFPNTPVIDQLLGLMLYLHSDEDEVLKKANLFNIKSAFYESKNPALKKFFGTQQKRSIETSFLERDTNDDYIKLSYDRKKEEVQDKYIIPLKKAVKLELKKHINEYSKIFDFIIQKPFSMDELIDTRKTNKSILHYEKDIKRLI